MSAKRGRLSDRVFAYLASHPDGTEPAELEAAFGLNPQEAIVVVTQLMEAGKVERQGKVYIAV